MNKTHTQNILSNIHSSALAGLVAGAENIAANCADLTNLIQLEDLSELYGSSFSNVEESFKELAMMVRWELLLREPEALNRGSCAAFAVANTLSALLSRIDASHLASIVGVNVVALEERVRSLGHACEANFLDKWASSGWGAAVQKRSDFLIKPDSSDLAGGDPEQKAAAQRWEPATQMLSDLVEQTELLFKTIDPSILLSRLGGAANNFVEELRAKAAEIEEAIEGEVFYDIRINIEKDAEPVSVCLLKRVSWEEADKEFDALRAGNSIASALYRTILDCPACLSDAYICKSSQ